MMRERSARFGGGISYGGGTCVWASLGVYVLRAVFVLFLLKTVF